MGGELLLEAAARFRSAIAQSDWMVMFQLHYMSLNYFLMQCNNGIKTTSLV